MNSDPPPEQLAQHSFTLEPNDTRHLAMLCGQLDGHLRQIEQRLGIRIHVRGNQFHLSGARPKVEAAERLFEALHAREE